jgi:hypothetical protein
MSLVASMVYDSGAAGASSQAASSAHVLLVGTFNGVPGQYSSIQAAVNASIKGDWILVAPGDYHETADAAVTPTQAAAGDFGGVLIQTPKIHLRGMDRSSVIVDGTAATATSPCSADPAQQNFGVNGANGAYGRNGIVVFKANNVSIDNLTVCNFLAGSGNGGNGIWWNGGDGSGRVRINGYFGRYLTLTSTFYGTASTAALYGIFSVGAQNGLWNHVYSSNFADSGMYVGACRQLCNMTIENAQTEYSALGYSGTNSGGQIVIQNSEFDNNKDGFSTNTQINGDPPAPQDGRCPNGAISPITGTNSCWVFMHNYVHDNNNPNVPQTGTASQGPTGTGMTVAGATYDTVIDNTFANNGAWGTLFVPFADSSPPSLHQTCSGTGGHIVTGFGCVYDPKGDALENNTFTHDGYFGNPSNSDFGQITFFGGEAQNCYSGNTYPDGSAPSNLEVIQPACGPVSAAGNMGGALLNEVLCDAGLGPCAPTDHYPQPTGVVMHPLPSLPSMPNPCAGVPANPWCPGGIPVGEPHGASPPRAPLTAGAPSTPGAPAQDVAETAAWSRLAS